MRAIDIGNPLNELTVTVRVKMPGRVRRWLGTALFHLGAWVMGFGRCDVVNES